MRIEWINDKNWNRRVHNAQRKIDLKDDHEYRQDVGKISVALATGFSVSLAYMLVVSIATYVFKETTVKDDPALFGIAMVGIALVVIAFYLDHKAKKRWGLL